MNCFQKKFGKAENTIVCIGDWEQKKHMKFSPPTKGIGMRKVLRKRGYNVFLVNEYNTSKMNNKDQIESTGYPFQKFQKMIVC